MAATLHPSMLRLEIIISGVMDCCSKSSSSVSGTVGVVRSMLYALDCATAACRDLESRRCHTTDHDTAIVSTCMRRSFTISPVLFRQLPCFNRRRIAKAA